MEGEKTHDDSSPKEQKSKFKDNILFIIIIACWMLFYLFSGSRTGVG